MYSLGISLRLFLTVKERARRSEGPPRLLLYRPARLSWGDSRAGLLTEVLAYMTAQLAISLVSPMKIL
jgi:hypothetical protein